MNDERNTLRGQEEHPASCLSFLRSEGKLFPMLLLLALGVILLLIAPLLSESKDPGEDSAETSAGSFEYDIGEFSDLAAYELYLEEKIEALCRGLDGVGEVQVSVYLRKPEGSGSYFSSGKGEQIEICGIGVICERGEDAQVVAKLTELISTVFRVGANKIYIADA